MRKFTRLMSFILMIAIMFSFLLMSMVSTNADNSISLPENAVEWFSWKDVKNKSDDYKFDALNGQYSIREDENGIFGEGRGELSFSSTNSDVVDEHWFELSNLNMSSENSIFSPEKFTDMKGLGLFVNLDASSYSHTIVICLESKTPGDPYWATSSVVKGETNLLTFSFLRLRKKRRILLTDFSDLTGRFKIIDRPVHETNRIHGAWNVKFSNVFLFSGIPPTTVADPYDPYQKKSGYLTGLPSEKISADTFIRSFTNTPADNICIYARDGAPLAADSYVGTDCKVNINGGKNITVVLYGDVDGNGIINVIDLVYIKKHVLKMQPLEGANLIAGNVDKSEDASLNVNDILLVKMHLLKIKYINQN